MQDNTPPRIPDISEDSAEEEYADDLVDSDDSDAGQQMAGNPDGFDDNFEVIEVIDSEDDEDIVADEVASLNLGSPPPPNDESKLSFKRHTGPVFGCALHPNRDLVATGSEDDSAIVWDSKTAEELFVIKGHKDTVTEVYFNHDGTYLATGDLSGELFVHRIHESSGAHDSAPKLKFTKIYEYSMGDMTWMRWHRAANVLFAGSTAGEVYIIRIPNGECKILPGDGEACEAGEITADGKKLFASYGMGVLKLWDIKAATVIFEVGNDHIQALQSKITTLACDKSSPLYMAGTHNGKVVFCTNNSIASIGNTEGCVESVAFAPPSPDLRLAASGTLNGQIAIWDLNHFSLRTICEHPETEEGITRVKWMNERILLVSTLHGLLYGYDARTGARKFILSGHKDEIYEFLYDPRERIILTVSEDHEAKIFDVPQIEN